MKLYSCVADVVIVHLIVLEWRRFASTSMMQPCIQTGASAFFTWVMETKLMGMPILVGWCGLIGQRPAIAKEQLYPLHNLKQICFCTHPTPYVYMQEYQKACDALLDGFKMDPGNSEIENALRYSISGYGFTAYLRVLVCDGTEWPTGLRSCASVNLEPIWFLVLLINTCKHFTEAWDAGARSNLLCHDVLRVYMYAGRRWSPWRYLMVLSWQPEWSVYTQEPQPAGSFFLSFYLCFILPYALAAARAVELWICWPAAYC